MISLSGAFDDIGLQNIQVGEFHAQMTLDNGETVRVVIPEAVSLPDIPLMRYSISPRRP